MNQKNTLSNLLYTYKEKDYYLYILSVVSANDLIMKRLFMPVMYKIENIDTPIKMFYSKAFIQITLKKMKAIIS